MGCGCGTVRSGLAPRPAPGPTRHAAVRRSPLLRERFARMSNSRALPCGEAAIRSCRPMPAFTPQKIWVLAAAVLGSTLAFIDESVVNVALPRIESELRTTLAVMQWVISAYTLTMSALLLIGGAAGDQFGRKRVFVIGVLAFTA